MGSFTVIIT
jgi:hypothetical protein